MFLGFEGTTYTGRVAEWDESEHPRHPRGSEKGGEFRSKQEGWVSSVLGKLGGIKGGRNLVDELDYDRLAEMVGETKYGFGADLALEEIYHQQGFHGKPTVVSQAKMDELEAKGYQVVYRGINSRYQEPGIPYPKDEQFPTGLEYAEMFRSGDTHRGGFGVYGNGTYATPSADLARGYANRHNGTVVRMALKPGARTITHEELGVIADQFNRDGQFRLLYEQYNRRLAAGEDPADVRADYEVERRRINSDPTLDRNHPRTRVLSDYGRLAAALGYDAILASPVPKGWRADDRGLEYQEWVILNRGALLVDETPLGTQYEEYARRNGGMMPWDKK